MGMQISSETTEKEKNPASFRLPSLTVNLKLRVAISERVLEYMLVLIDQGNTSQKFVFPYIFFVATLPPWRQTKLAFQN